MSAWEGLDMPLREAMETQRSIRRLKPDPVDDALILRLIELALKAPTGSNSQGWEFIVVKDPVIKSGIARLNRSAWWLYGNLARWVTRDDPRTQRIIAAVQWQADHFEETPVIVVACLRGYRLFLPHILAASFYGSIFPSVQNLLLAARAVGLGAGLITLPLWNLLSLRRLLGLPWTVTPCALMPMGWPRERYGPTARKPVHQVVSFDRFGNRPAATRSPS